MQADGDLLDVDVQVFHLVAQKQHGEGRVIVNDGAAFAIENAAAGGKDGNGTNAISLRQAVVVVAARDLQPPESHRQDQKNGKDHVLHTGEPDLRYSVVS